MEGVLTRLYLVLDEVVTHSGADPASLQEDLAEAGGRGRLAEGPALVTQALTKQEVGSLLQSPLYRLTVSSFPCAGQILAELLVDCGADLLVHQHRLLYPLQLVGQGHRLLSSVQILVDPNLQLLHLLLHLGCVSCAVWEDTLICNSREEEC